MWKHRALYFPFEQSESRSNDNETGGNHTTINEAKELAYASFMEAYAHVHEEKETNIGATANYIMIYVNNILLPHGFACGIKWKKEKPDFVLELYKKECNIGAVYCKEDSK